MKLGGKNKAQSRVQHSTLHRLPLCCKLFPWIQLKGKKFGSKSPACPFAVPESTLLSSDFRQDRIYVQLHNLCWVPQWICSGDFSFPKDTSRSAVLTGVLILNLTFKERMTSANCPAKRCCLQKANCESSKAADVSLVRRLPVCTKFTSSVCILGQISSCHRPGSNSPWYPSAQQGN